MFGSIITAIFSLGLILGGACLIALARRSGPAPASTCITIFNHLTPRLVRALTSIESHPNESSYSASNYIKTTAFRWVNTAVIFSIITPFTDTIQNGKFLLSSVFTMFYFELLLVPALGFADIWGNIQRHFFAPRAPTQRTMNLNFKAGTYDIGDMYTNITKVFFLTVFYCSIFPAGYFFASAIFFAYYWVNKFAILRSRSQGPQVSATVTKFSTNFFLLCLLAYAVLASYNFTQFPFDSACESTTTSIDEYVDEYSLKTYNGTELLEGLLQITENDKVYKFCDQDLFRRFVFPPTDSIQTDDAKWMNVWQEDYSEMYGWAMIVMLILVGASLVLGFVYKVFQLLFLRGVSVSGFIFSKKNRKIIYGGRFITLIFVLSTTYICLFI